MRPCCCEEADGVFEVGEGDVKAGIALDGVADRHDK
jgi:hypothetical protein